MSDSLKSDINVEYDKGKPFFAADIIGYVPKSIVVKTLIKKATGNITVSAFDTGESQMEKTSPFELFIEVIDGKAEIIIDTEYLQLDKGCSVIIPAHARHVIKAKEKFKIISTIIKSGYEGVS